MATTEAIPSFEATDLAAITDTVTGAQKVFYSGRTKDLEYRLVQLRRFYWAIKDNASLLQAALQADMRKSPLESLLTEIDWCLQDCLYMIKNLETFAKDEKITDVPLMYAPMNARIRKDPLGTVLIIGAYNFPVNLSFCPLIGAIAAGCTAILKPSENAPATAMVMKKIMEEGLDQEAYGCVNGAVAETTALLDLKWDKIFYTGGSQVGAIIATKAAKTLTPVTLELGGRNPAFVTKNADLKLAAKRLMWGKAMNAGQVCLSQNYFLVDKAVLPQFTTELRNTYDSFFPQGAKASPDYSRIINVRHFQRMQRMIVNSKGTIILGGDMDEDDLYIEPTIVQVDSIEDTMMAEESFGPLMALMPYDSLEEAIQIMNQVDRTPLALFVFGNQAEQDTVLNGCLSGGASMNDGYFHASVPTLPFGGVGTSGTGAYRGKASFDTFSHRRTVTTTPTWVDGLLRVRYMPYDMGKYKQMTALNATPDFDRSGRVQASGIGYWLKVLVGLGGTKAKGAFVRWAVVALAVYMWKLTGNRK